jgi:hypothetical protein
MASINWPQFVNCRVILTDSATQTYNCINRTVTLKKYCEGDNTCTIEISYSSEKRLSLIIPKEYLEELA